ncbi:MAG: FAD/NAD(P)-binding protein [Amaricoccus sp.]|uniref:FAD/NAD(P)-binding protein n=1 Tax=Amaricoccus sp. TaxID=1872485 RepID=UPI0039E4AC8E
MMMDKPRRSRPVVAILGGGLSGAVTALNLGQTLGPDAAEIVVVEPREMLGGGLAYSTGDAAHRINVPAAKMTIVSDQPNHFMDWLAAERITMSPSTLTLRGDFFPERRIFGRYIAAQLAPLVARGIVRHCCTSAVAARRAEGRWLIDLADGTSLVADFVVLAMSHPAPAVPGVLRDLAGSPALVADPYDNARIAALAGTERILIVGTGLTSADVVASLDRLGHRGRITALSRHGLRSRGHGVVEHPSEADFATDPAQTAVSLLRRIRAAVAADAALGQSWHATLDRVREQGPAIWAALPAGERRRLVRHLRTAWDVHRFRVAPQVEDVVEREMRRGRLDVVAARLVTARETPDGIEVAWRPRGSATVVTATFGAVVVTTGPDHGTILQSNPVFRTLAADGLLCADPNGLGLLVEDHCRSVDAGGGLSDTLLVAGPLARGHVGELMGVPEATRHAEHVAGILSARIRDIAGPLLSPLNTTG